MSVMPKCEKCGRYFILSDGGPCNCEVKLRLAIRDLYRGDGGPLNDYNQGWNDGTDAAAEVFSAERMRDRPTPETDAFCKGPYKADTTQGLLNLAIEHARRLERQRDAAVEALTMAKEYIFNPFEKDNQCNTYHRICAVLREIEGKS